MHIYEVRPRRGFDASLIKSKPNGGPQRAHLCHFAAVSMLAADLTIQPFNASTWRRRQP
jgi:hypothetical protein